MLQWRLDMKRPPGYRAAIVLMCLNLLDVLVNPMVGVFFAAVYFGVAWAIRRGQAWAPLATAGLLLVPVGRAVANGGLRGWSTEAIVFGTANLFVGLWFLRAGLRLRLQPASVPAWPWIALLCLFRVGEICVRPYNNPSASIKPTILIGDRFFVDTITWRTGRTPDRGDIVAFRYPLMPEMDYVKRVVGLPGDRLHFTRRSLVRNGKLVDEPYVVQSDPELNEYRDSFPSGASNQELRPSAQEMIDHYVKDGELTVPRDSYFVLGDNRDDSDDSRYWGLVPCENILGSPVLIFDSHEISTGSIPSILNLRWNRI
jgi:signal peptidase I